MNLLDAASPDLSHLLHMEKGTRTVDDKGNLINLIEIRIAEELPELPANTLLIGDAYNFSPSGIVFDMPVSITLGYDISQLPEETKSVTLAYYTPELGWNDLTGESGTVAELGKITAPVNHFSLFAVLVKITPAMAEVSESPTHYWWIIGLIITILVSVWFIVKKYVMGSKTEKLDNEK